MKNTENLWKILTEINETIKFAEAKGLAIISSSGILTAFLFSKQDLDKYFEYKLNTFLFLICIIFLFISILFALLCIKPNFKNKSEFSLFFFKSIIENFNEIDGHLKYLEKFTEVDFSFDKQIAEQILVKSKIANQKYKHINTSIYFFIIFLFFILTLMCIN